MPAPHFKIEYHATVVELGNDPTFLRAEPRPRAVLDRGKTFCASVAALTVQEARQLPMYGRVKITIEPAEET